MTVEELKAETAKLPPDAQPLQLEELIRELQRGIEQADRGELIEADEVFAQLRQRHINQD
ncbi:MAG: hypothetical protein WCD79_10125 [Chthoniobacteraceae bacterium]